MVCRPEHIRREWAADEIPVLSRDIVEHLSQNPGDMDYLMQNVSAMISEGGDPVGDLASMAFIREIICIVRVDDACYVLDEGMNILVTAMENVGEVYFVD